MKKHNKLKRITAGITALLMAGVLSSPLISLAADDNQEEDTLPELAAGDTMNTNYGTITTNNGTITYNDTTGTVTTNNFNITSNYGEVTTNEAGGTITYNYDTGTVTTNNFNITYNYGEVTTNSGTITYNYGTVDTNSSTGKVTDNKDKVTTNSGTIELNAGTIETNSSTGEVYNNDGGTITTNNGTVDDNYGGTITTNNGTVDDNYGTVDTNSSTGKVTNNEGTIYENSGTVTTNNSQVNINNGTIDANTSTGTVGTNAGTVTTNTGTGTITTNSSTGTVENNNGTITTNDGTITESKGTVTTNNGTINDNQGTVDTNEGTVTSNLGNITTNNATIATNDTNGTVKTNEVGATITYNYGTVETNTGTITENTNSGEITTNDGTVDTNVGTIETNNLTVGTNKNTITDNFGTVNTNEGTIVNNYGTVVTDNGIGTVTNRYYEIDLSSAPNVELSGEGYSFKNGKHYVLDGKSVTISPATGYRIDASPTVTGGNIGDNNDGTYTLSGVTGNTALTVSTSPIAVDNITGVPSSMTEGESLTLSGTVEPGDALNQTITWSVKDAGTTGAAISGNVLSAATAGTVIITATIANGLGTADYTQDFTVTVKNKPVYAVTVIGGTGGTAAANPASASAGTVITLTATADEGYEFAGWKVTAGNVTLPSSPSAAFTMPNSAVTIEASFTPIEDTPTTDTPTTDAPSGDTPSGDTPSTDTPNTAPTTDTPSVQVGRVVIGELTEVPDSLKDKFPTLERLKAAMLMHILMLNGYTEGNTAFYDVKLQISLDGGKTWVAATEDSFPKEGITVTLPYPDGTGSLGHDFAVAHMFTLTSERLGTTAGDVEAPQVTELADGLQVTFKGLSPVSVSWRNAEVSNATGGVMFRDRETTSPKTGDFGAVKVISSAAEKM